MKLKNIVILGNILIFSLGLALITLSIEMLKKSSLIIEIDVHNFRVILIIVLITSLCQVELTTFSLWAVFFEIPRLLFVSLILVLFCCSMELCQFIIIIAFQQQLVKNSEQCLGCLLQIKAINSTFFWLIALMLMSFFKKILFGLFMVKYYSLYLSESSDDRNNFLPPFIFSGRNNSESPSEVLFPTPSMQQLDMIDIESIMSSSKSINESSKEAFSFLTKLRTFSFPVFNASELESESSSISSCTSQCNNKAKYELSANKSNERNDLKKTMSVLRTFSIPSKTLVLNNESSSIHSARIVINKEETSESIVDNYVENKPPIQRTCSDPTCLKSVVLTNESSSIHSARFPVDRKETSKSSFKNSNLRSYSVPSSKAFYLNNDLSIHSC